MRAGAGGAVPHFGEFRPRGQPRRRKFRDSPELTPAKLLALSRQKAGYLAAAVAQKRKASEAKERAGRSTSTAFIAIFAGTLAALVSVATGVKLLRRRKRVD